MRTASKTPQLGAAAGDGPLDSGQTISVRLEGPHGARWTAIGGGATVGDAVEFALWSAPPGVRWRVVGWSDLFGE